MIIIIVIMITYVNSKKHMSAQGGANHKQLLKGEVCRTHYQVWATAWVNLITIVPLSIVPLSCARLTKCGVVKHQSIPSGHLSLLFLSTPFSFLALGPAWYLWQVSCVTTCMTRHWRVNLFLFVHVKDYNNSNICVVQMAAEHTNVLSLSTEQNDCDAV